MKNNRSKLILSLLLALVVSLVTIQVHANELKKERIKEAEPGEVDVQAWSEQMTGIMQYFQERYPNPEEIDMDRFIEEEAPVIEEMALLYCQAWGYEGPCDPNEGVALSSSTSSATNMPWWWWIVDSLIHWFLDEFASNVGVIPHGEGCPSGTDEIRIYHDDEDYRNYNHYSGWKGAFTIGTDTNMVFCRARGTSFGELDGSGTRDDYALLQLGLFCPKGGETVVRYFDNEDDYNQNTDNGWFKVLPNVNFLGRNWVMFFCDYDDGSGQLSQMPDLGYAYGVFATSNFSQQIATGYFYKDDEDAGNVNFWINGPKSMLYGGTNSEFYMARVK